MSTPPVLKTDRWNANFPRVVQALGFAGGVHEIFISHKDRPFLLVFIGALLLGMEGLRGYQRRPSGE